MWGLFSGEQDSFVSPVPVISGMEVLPEKRGESLVDQGFSPGRVRGSGGWRGWREGMGDFPDLAGRGGGGRQGSSTRDEKNSNHG